MMAYGGAIAVASREVVRKERASPRPKRWRFLRQDLEFSSWKVQRERYATSDHAAEEIARRHAGESPHPLDARGDIRSRVPTPSGAHVAEVEIDPTPGKLAVLSYVAVDELRARNQPHPARGPAARRHRRRGSAGDGASTAVYDATAAAAQAAAS